MAFYFTLTPKLAISAIFTLKRELHLIVLNGFSPSVMPTHALQRVVRNHITDLVKVTLTTTCSAVYTITSVPPCHDCEEIYVYHLQYKQ